MLAFRMNSDSRQEEDDDRPDKCLRPINSGSADPTDDVKSHFSLRHSHDDSEFYYHDDRPQSARVPHTAREVLADTCVGVITSSSSAPSTARGEPSYNHHHHNRPPHERSRLGPAASSKLSPQSSSPHKNKEPTALAKQSKQSKQFTEKRNNTNKKKELITVSEVSPLKTIGDNTTTTGITSTGTGTPQAEPPSFFRALQTEYQSKIKRLQEENSSLRRQLDDTRIQLKQQHQLLVKERQDKKLRLAKTLSPPDAADNIINNNNGNNNAANDDKNHSSTLQKLAKALSPPEKGLIKAERVVIVPSPKKEKK
jgi:hypothetical protein